MSERDDLWREIASLEGVWDGTLLPDDTPAWCTGFATLVEAAGGPPTAEELATEAEVVVAMQRILRAASNPTDLDPDVEFELAFGADVGLLPDHGRAPRSPGVRRLVAAKIVAIVAVLVLGATAAAATAGVVVPLLRTPKNDPHPRVEVTTTVPAVGGRDGTTGATGTGHDRRGQDGEGDGDGSDATTTDATGTEATTSTTSPTGSGAANGNGNANGAGANHGNGTTNSTTTTTTSTTTTTPDRPGNGNGNGHGAPPPNDHGKKKGLSDAPAEDGAVGSAADPAADATTNYAV
jgi:hypothetical protein